VNKCATGFADLLRIILGFVRITLNHFARARSPLKYVSHLRVECKLGTLVARNGLVILDEAQFIRHSRNPVAHLFTCYTIILIEIPGLAEALPTCVYAIDDATARLSQTRLSVTFYGFDGLLLAVGLIFMASFGLSFRPWNGQSNVASYFNCGRPSASDWNDFNDYIVSTFISVVIVY